MALMSQEPPCDWYSVLEVPQTASAEEIRKSYQRLVKQYHPDKLGPELDKEKRAQAVENFHKLSKAYAIIGDNVQRSAYDTSNKTAVLTQTWPISDVIDLDEMTFDPDKATFTLDCRCGGNYVVTETEMDVGVDIVCCSTCTLSIKVLYQQAQDKEPYEI